MSKINEIKRKKASTRKTAHITHALELVSSSKLAKITDKKIRTEKYANLLSEMIGNIAESCKRELIDEFMTPHQKNDGHWLYCRINRSRVMRQSTTYYFAKYLRACARHKHKNKVLLFALLGQRQQSFLRKMTSRFLSPSKPDLSPDTTLPACQKMIYQYQQQNVNTVYVFIIK